VSLVVDAGPLVSLAMADDPAARAVEQTLAKELGEIVVTAQITAEVDYLLRERVGVQARRAFLADLAAGRFRVQCLDLTDYALIRAYNIQYADLDVGLSDLTIVATAHRLQTKRILTFDQRHFRALRPLDGGSFILLPADEP